MEPAPAPLVEVDGLTFAYRGQPALRGVDLSLRAGEVLVMLGPNGAGKSSLMRLIAGRLRPDAGTVRVCGGDPQADRAVRRRIGWVPQAVALYPRLTVRENLDVFARLAGLSGLERRRVLPRVLERSATAEVAGRIVGTLSGGYQRRVNIAASLLAEPDLILLDEPTQGVDLEAREAIHAVLAQLCAAGAGLLLATHDFSEAERLADRVAILGGGRVLREGVLSVLMRPLADAPPVQDVRLAALPEPAAASALRALGFTPLADPLAWRATQGAADGREGAALLAVLRAQGLDVAELRLRRPGLETLYRDALASDGRRAAAPTPLREVTA